MTTSLIEPESLQSARESEQSKQWEEAMRQEIQSLEANGTWELVPWNGQTLVDNRWTFKVKLDNSGNVSRYKARLVARGFSQRLGIDYWDTFSPVIRMESVRSIIAIAAAKKMVVQQFDVKTAFLHGELEETIYMKQPAGFGDGSGRVCKLKKSIYGLKQAANCWNKKFVKTLEGLGLTQCTSDPCVFTGKTVIVGIYVDDGLIVGESDIQIRRVENSHIERPSARCCTWQS